jgi:hypothetical protein
MNTDETKRDAEPTPASTGSVDALSVLRKLVDGVRGMTYGDPDDPSSVEASTIVRWAIDEIEQLRGSIRWHKEVLVGAEEKMARMRLTDSERKAIRFAAGEAAAIAEQNPRSKFWPDHAVCLRSAAERLG